MDYLGQYNLYYCNFPILLQNHSDSEHVSITTFENKVKQLEAVDAQLQGNLVRSILLSI